VFTAAAAVVLMAFAGLAVDMGMIRYQKRLQQTAADAAALAGASNLTFPGVQAGAQAASATNGFTDNTSGGACADSTNTAVGSVTVTICNHPQDVTINGTLVPGGPHVADITTTGGAVGSRGGLCGGHRLGSSVDLLHEDFRYNQPNGNRARGGDQLRRGGQWHNGWLFVHPRAPEQNGHKRH